MTKLWWKIKMVGLLAVKKFNYDNVKVIDMKRWGLLPSRNESIRRMMR